MRTNHVVLCTWFDAQHTRYIFATTTKKNNGFLLIANKEWREKTHYHLCAFVFCHWRALFDLATLAFVCSCITHTHSPIQHQEPMACNDTAKRQASLLLIVTSKQQQQQQQQQTTLEILFSAKQVQKLFIFTIYTPCFLLNCLNK